MIQKLILIFWFRIIQKLVLNGFHQILSAFPCSIYATAGLMMWNQTCPFEWFEIWCNTFRYSNCVIAKLFFANLKTKESIYFSHRHNSSINEVFCPSFLYFVKQVCCTISRLMVGHLSSVPYRAAQFVTFADTKLASVATRYTGKQKCFFPVQIYPLILSDLLIRLLDVLEAHLYKQFFYPSPKIIVLPCQRVSQAAHRSKSAQTNFVFWKYQLYFVGLLCKSVFSTATHTWFQKSRLVDWLEEFNIV